MANEAVETKQKERLKLIRVGDHEIDDLIDQVYPRIKDLSKFNHLVGRVINMCQDEKELLYIYGYLKTILEYRTPEKMLKLHDRLTKELGSAKMDNKLYRRILADYDSAVHYRVNENKIFIVTAGTMIEWHAEDGIVRGEGYDVKLINDILQEIQIDFKEKRLKYLETIASTLEALLVDNELPELEQEELEA